MYKIHFIDMTMMNKQINETVFFFSSCLYMHSHFHSLFMLVAIHSFFSFFLSRKMDGIFTGYSINKHVPTHFTYLILTLTRFIVACSSAAPEAI